MDPNQIPKGAGQLETDGSGKPLNQPGVYEHPESGARLTILPDAKSTAQADALVRVGFKKVAEPPTRNELKDLQDKQRQADMALEKKGVQPGINADPNLPKFSLTSDKSKAEQEAALAEAEARATAAEAELARLKGEDAAPAEQEAPAESEESSEPETPSEPEESADEETPAEESAEGDSETQTNEEESK